MPPEEARPGFKEISTSLWQGFSFLGRTANDNFIRRYTKGVCGVCSNLFPAESASRSDRPRGWMENDGESAEKRQSLYSDRIWSCFDQDLEAITDRADRWGCEYCRMILEAMKVVVPGWPSPDAPEFTTFDFNLMELSPPVIGARHFRHSLRIQLEFFRAEDVSNRQWRKLPQLAQGKQRSLSSDASEVWSFIADCLGSCRDEHPGCKGVNLPQQLPKRLLALGSDNDSMSLYESQPDDEGHFMALSYCWGGSDTIKLLTTNHKSLLLNIPWNGLAACLQDAITVTRRLNIRYLWIDTLCIIQDDRRDWEIEAAQMVNIYTNSFATISAASSPNVHMPFLKLRERSWLSQLTCLEEADGTNSGVYWRQIVTPYANVEQGPSKAKFTEQGEWTGSVYQRAWCYQEAVLSKRIIHYTDGPVIWECQTIRRAEDELPPFTPTIAPFQFTTIVERGKTWLDISWWRAVSAYTRRDLSFDLDTLPAFSGIAARFASQKKSQYLAGLWESSLLHDLTWHCLPNVTHRTPGEYIAPSWSWASMRCAVTMNTWNVKALHATIMSASIKPVSKNPYGTVSTGEVVLRSPLLPVRISWAKVYDVPKATLVRERSEKATDVSLILDTMIYGGNGLMEDGDIVPTFRRAAPGDELDIDLSSILELGHQVYLCPILTAHLRLEMVGLVLGRSPLVPGAFVRLGICWKAPSKWLEDLEEVEVRIV